MMRSVFGMIPPQNGHLNVARNFTLKHPSQILAANSKNEGFFDCVARHPAAGCRKSSRHFAQNDTVAASRVSATSNVSFLRH